ncbi:hypothetical protein SEMRO_378_G130230.1 [Seminavis robusta]|uniref:Uncharacterized protein n=1 Tax=Seminavis robusta TaxID=568900 RepID=A0A9N8E025_9STRA|nr:hypothetical protein SEMRO_378_G130230.1 [Seminavis robusta]|eukprot:Sro378_g130230.1 n/a (221) ;mRNA; f:19159-19978
MEINQGGVPADTQGMNLASRNDNGNAVDCKWTPPTPSDSLGDKQGAETDCEGAPKEAQPERAASEEKLTEPAEELKQNEEAPTNQPFATNNEIDSDNKGEAVDDFPDPDDLSEEEEEDEPTIDEIAEMVDLDESDPDHLNEVLERILFKDPEDITDMENYILTFYLGTKGPNGNRPGVPHFLKHLELKRDGLLPHPQTKKTPTRRNLLSHSGPPLLALHL